MNNEWMLLIGTDSNYGESTQMQLEKTQITTSCHIHQEGGEFECFSVHLSFYKLFPIMDALSIYLATLTIISAKIDGMIC